MRLTEFLSCHNLFRLFLIALLPVSSVAVEAVRVWEEPLVLPTYKVKAPETAPMFFRYQSYQGASRYIYPYALEDNITSDKADQSYKALYLENEYIKLCVLPQIGGRLFYATDKTNGYEIFYRQSVVKPANIGMTGAWISGGIEFCVFHHHRASTNLPVDYAMSTNPDGSATIWIGEIEPRHRMKWTIGITLFPGKSYIEVDGRLMNPTASPNSFLYWANVATHVNEDYQIIFPPSTEFGTYHAKNSFSHWPVTREAYHKKTYYENGIDASWWKNHPEPISFFAHDLKDGFLAGYDHGKQAGTMHVANPHIVKGAKLWEWGPGKYGSMWDTEVLTDNDGPYAELMTGAYSDNQPDYSWIKPYEYKTFQQYWYPLRESGGAVAANLEATLNLKPVEENVFLVAANTTALYEDAEVVLDVGGREVYRNTVTLSPAQPFSEKVTLEGVDPEQIEIALSDKNGRELLSYRPVVNDPDAPLPDPVIPPLRPAEIETIEELYLTGLRLRQFHNARVDYEDYFIEALRRDPMDTRCNTQMGIKYKEEGRFEEAIAHLQRAIDRLTASYTRPRNCEALFHLGVIQQQMGQAEAAYETLYRAAWDSSFASAAYYHLAQISCGRGDFATALTEIGRSLSSNSSNINALNLKTALLRMTGRTEEAVAVAEQVLRIDILNQWGHRELALLQEDKSPAFVKLMGDNPETWLELAVAYMNAGFAEEASGTLKQALEHANERTVNYPTVHYYLGYLACLQGDSEAGRMHFLKAKELPTDYCFPYRLETVHVYRKALELDPADSRACYYLGNLLFDKQPEEAMGYWQEAVRIEPELAIAHRNIGWGYRYALRNPEKAIQAYEEAIRHDAGEAIYFHELDRLYAEIGTDLKTRYDLLTKNHDVVSQRPDALLREILVLVASGEPEQAIDYLLGYFFPRQEGVDNLHDTYADACLQAGVMRLQDGDPVAAMKFFEMAAEYPENHQTRGSRKDEKPVQILYFQTLAAEAMGEVDLAEQLAKAILSKKLRKPEYKIYQAIVAMRSGHAKKALRLVAAIEASAQDLFSPVREVDFFSKFGEADSEQQRLAEANYLMGMASWLRGDGGKAQKLLQKAYKLDPAHLWAKYFSTRVVDSGL